MSMREKYQVRVSNRLGGVFQYRTGPISQEVLADLLTERRQKNDRAAELQFLIARGREAASLRATELADLDKLHEHTVELIATCERLCEIDSQSLRQEVEDIFPDMPECSEKDHLLKVCGQLREESEKCADKSIQAEIAWKALQDHIRTHRC